MIYTTMNCLLNVGHTLDNNVLNPFFFFLRFIEITVYFLCREKKKIYTSLINKQFTRTIMISVYFSHVTLKFRCHEINPIKSSDWIPIFYFNRLGDKSTSEY